MNKKLLAIFIAIAPLLASAQLGDFMHKVKNKVNQKTTQRVDEKVDRAIDKTLDEVESKETASSPAPKNKEETASPPAENKTTDAAEQRPSLKRFSKYDFIPGEQIVYVDNFESEAIGELPTAWNTNGSGEVVTIENIPGKWLQLHKAFIYLTSNQKIFSENYTVEFDLIMQLKNNGWMFPTFSVGLLSTKDEPGTDNSFLKEQGKYAYAMATLYPGVFNSSKATLESSEENKIYFKSQAKDCKEMEEYFGKPMHIAMQLQKGRWRVWINETKSFDVPKGMPTAHNMNQLFFRIGETNYAEEQYGMFISNIKVAKGIPDTRHKLMDEGKFSTTAILFDVNAANIRPESAGVLKEIATILDQNKEVNIKIIGHTDGDGADASNLTLSQKRAEAVKNALSTEYGIDASRIETDGKGESTPVSDNKTKEGKAANRRVEFIKL